MPRMPRLTGISGSILFTALLMPLLTVVIVPHLQGDEPIPEPLIESPDLGAVVYDEPSPGSPGWFSKLFCPLPARVEMLAKDSPDAAETEKLRTLRETYTEVLQEKTALLNAEALAAEIESQRRQVTELKALKELQKLQQSLQELSDKFPDSEAGKQARDVLNLLKQRMTHPHMSLTPMPDHGHIHDNAAPPYLQSIPSNDAVKVHPLGDFPIYRSKPVRTNEQPIRPRAVPVPIDNEKRPSP